MFSNSLIFTATYNEVNNITLWYSRTRLTAPDAKILVIDDSSTDGTHEKLLKISEEDQNFILHTRSRKLGLASAHRFAFEYALKGGFEYLVTMDADLSHEPEQIPILYKIIESYDFVIGTRRSGGKTDYVGIRKLISITGNILARFLIPTGLSEYTTSFRLFNSSALKALSLNQSRIEGYAFFMQVVEFLYQSGFRLGEVPIHFRDRKHGKSKIPRMQVMKSIIVLLNLTLKRLRS